MYSLTQVLPFVLASPFFYTSALPHSSLLERSDHPTSPEVAKNVLLWNPTTGPVYHDVAQGTTGDCWLDACMVAVAYADQNQLKNIMYDPSNQDGTVPVILYHSGSSTTNTITKKLSSQVGSENSDAAPYVANGNFVWPAVMEDAFKEFAASYKDTGIALDLNGGSGGQAFSSMYGNSRGNVYKDISRTSDDDLWALWERVQSNPTVSSTPSEANDGSTPDRLPSSHMYTAMRCDRNAGIVTLRNPWGRNPGDDAITDRGDGVFDISFANWKKNFHGITAVVPSSTNTISPSPLPSSGAAQPTARCGIHVVQYQKHEDNVNPTGDYKIEGTIFDGAHKPISSSKRQQAPTGETLSIGGLGSPLSITAELTDDKPLTIKYSSQTFATDQAQCSQGDWDSGSRKIDCGFAC